MASRSFKPASYLASAAQAQQKPSRSPRPSFVRTSSSSSNLSTKSDDSFIATLRSLNTNCASEGSTAFHASKENDRNSGGASSPRTVAPGSPVSRQTKFDDTPSRKRSKPIAIELPSRNTATAYTPLTGRGDHHKGGYFPEFDDFSKTYKDRSFMRSGGGGSTPCSPSSMSASSSVMSSPTEVTPKGPTSVFTPLLNPTAPIIDALGIPAGKYYPSNYNSPANTRVSSPTPAAPLPPTLTIPPTTTTKSKRQKSGHERDSSDVKRKLQQYQRDMIAQARLATSHTAHGLKLQMPKPVSPKLMPAGSPGPITPLELEESAGYLTGGTRARGNSLIGNGLEKERQLVEEIISVEKGRAMEIEHRKFVD